MLSLRRLSFVCVSVLLVATVARAGIFGTPLEDPSVCGEISIAGTGLSDPNVFTVSPKCVSLCRKAESACEKYARKVIACYDSWFKDSATFQMRNCAEYQPAEAEKLCRAQVTANLVGIKAKVQSARSTSLADCVTWGSQCELDCMGTM